jgi:hypothetical protein
VILYSSSSPRLLLVYVPFLLFTSLGSRSVVLLRTNIEVETIGSSTGTNDEHTSLERHAKRL